MTPASLRRVAANGAEFVVRVYGEQHAGETPLLLVHGWGGDGTEWERHARLWSKHRTVVVPDLRGHGASSRAGGPEAFGPGPMASDLAAVLGMLGIGPVVAIGHSMGGQTVTSLAVDRPRLVTALVILDPAYGADETELRRLPEEQKALAAQGPSWAVDFLQGAFGPRLPTSARRRHEQLISAMDPRVLLQCRDGMYLAQGAFGSKAAARRMLSKRTQPVLALYSRDGAATWERRQYLPPGSRVVAWPDCGHFLHEERPNDLVALVDSWETTLERDGPGPVPTGPAQDRAWHTP